MLLCTCSFGQTRFCAVGWGREFTHIDPTQGATSPTRHNLPRYLQALANSPSGVLYAAQCFDSSYSLLYRLAPQTGDTSRCLRLNTDARGMAFSPTGVLYVIAGTTTMEPTPKRLRIINLGDGTYREIGQLHGDTDQCQGIAFSPDGRLFGVSPRRHTQGTYALFTIDPDSAVTHMIAQSTSCDLSQSLVFAPDGSLYAIGDQFAQLNPVTGVVVGTVFSLSSEYRGLEVIRPGPATAVARWRQYR